ncbi:MAG: O-methyltransferase [Flavobacteriales bacterium]
MSGFSDRLFEASEFLRHQWHAKTRHGVHSPLVYELMDRTLRLNKTFADFERIEAHRQGLLKCHDVLEVQDFGAGSRIFKGERRRVSHIAQTALQKPAIAQTLFKWINRFQLKNRLELGTCLGITTAYLALANQKGSVYTVEGSPALMAQAERTWQALNIPNIYGFTGLFQDQLAQVFERQSTFDFVYLDGDHRKDKVLALWDQLKNRLEPEGWFVLDDIHWSPGMKAAWDHIRADHTVTLSMDFFDVGIVSCDPKRRKEHFQLNLI